MGKRANPMAVKSALTYDINEAAVALGKTPATIRNWIKDGLAVMSSRKPYLILGAAIQEYLRAKYKAAKRPLGPDQLFCLSCRAAQRPAGMSVTIGRISQRTSLLKGVCERCDGVCTRMIATSTADSFAAAFKITKEAGSEP
ncbi:helix-turn-helix domain-containing protein [Yoonia sp. R2-816]|uniref:helix-turn-helix domain-containing protein n=1 Tax=Yoonia sp. R2-816 TaxID=3342638 RepID=UPI003728BEED